MNKSKSLILTITSTNLSPFLESISQRKPLSPSCNNINLNTNTSAWEQHHFSKVRRILNKLVVESCLDKINFTNNTNRRIIVRVHIL